MTDITCPQEVWKPIGGHEDRYSISNLGRVWSNLTKNMLKPFLAGRYLAVDLRLDGESARCYVHHLVATAFIGLRPDGQEVCHGPGGSDDNRASNLRYDTHYANMRDTLDQGTHLSLLRTHCVHGHEMTAENTYRRIYGSADGGEKRRDRCKTCLKAKSKHDYALWKQRQALK
ncbi:HNH endonuclease [Cryobacterium sp. PH31-AA6]|uniref:NUMOD4 domain-containing protein n=1 Tax=Cryobacterium sp. PH31-AA6 TaxID=3046205 RepID=UPI0024B9009B|nr:HNH endonuclease [Cryobacterium sp. PH31-AA6]MDJ0323168.1 HNH endonuclease [Cryobacterium sp. PH31-AA6]